LFILGPAKNISPYKFYKWLGEFMLRQNTYSHKHHCVFPRGYS